MYGCLGINYLFLELIESNVMVNLVIIMMIGCFDYILINYSKFFLMVENRIVVVLLEVLSKDDGWVLNGWLVLMGCELIFIICLWYLLSE